MTLYELQRRLKSYDLTSEIAKAIKESKAEMLDLQRKQLLEGRNSMNIKIAPRYRSKYYAKYKRARNAKPGYGVPDLFNTGDFQREIDVKITTKEHEFFSRDEKSPMLVEKYPLIFGLNAKSKEQYSKNTLLPILRRNLRTKLK